MSFFVKLIENTIKEKEEFESRMKESLEEIKEQVLEGKEYWDRYYIAEKVYRDGMKERQKYIDGLSEDQYMIEESWACLDNNKKKTASQLSAKEKEEWKKKRTVPFRK